MAPKAPKGGAAAVRAAVALAPPADRAPGAPDPGTAWPFGFDMRPEGLFKLPSKEGENPQRLCGPFSVLGESRPEGNDAWGLLLRWLDRDGNPHEWIMPRALLAGEAAELRQRLAACGLDVVQSDGARRGLVDALARVKCDRRVRTVPRIGWHIGAEGGAVFVLPGRNCGIAPKGETLALDLDPRPTVFRARGDLAGWRDQVAARCAGNSRLVFAVSLAFAGTLLTPLREEGGGFHLRGDSSKGKTTGLHLAASVWGAPIGADPFVRQWRATANALEMTAAAHNDCLLPLDEIGQADPREIGEAGYMLANGQGKDRMRDRGGLRRTATWRTLFLSTGEESLGDLMARGGRVVKAGQEVRFLDVPADAGAGLGMFETLHGAENGDAFARELRQAGQQQHGTAGAAFLEWLATRLAQDPLWPSEELAPELAGLRQSLAPPGADGQVLRAAGRFALVALAGELATEAGVTGWEAGEAKAAAFTCFRAWLDARGGAGSREAQHLVEAVRRFIGTNGGARFETIKDAAPGIVEAEPGDPRYINRAGWKWMVPPPDQAEASAGRKLWCYGFLPTVFAAEVCRPLGMQDREALKKLHALGMIEVEQRGGEGWTRFKVRTRVAGHGRPELVVIRPTVLEGQDEPEAG
jgi:putative DNA primase/helicase